MSEETEPSGLAALGALRADYGERPFDDAHAHPLAQFERWLADALRDEDGEPNAMTLATVREDGTPDARVVLLRGCDRHGLVFYTNYESCKGKQLASNPAVTLVFYWSGANRQVRIDGRAERVSAAESDAYFATRPRGHQVSAWASEQSATLAGRHVIEERAHDIVERFPGDIPRPEQWGGYRVVPISFEFWQGRRDRFHDRIRYRRTEASWHMERLAP